MTKLIKTAVAVVTFGAVIGIASVSGATTHPTYALGHAKSCRVDYVKHTARHMVSERVKVGGKWVTKKVERRYVACVYSPPRLTLTVASPTTSGVVTNVKANIDPSWALATTTPQSPPVPVTFSYSAGVTNGSLPAGELTLSIFVHGSVSNAGGCQANVGGDISSAQCTVSVPQWGQYDLITSYSSGVSNVASTGATETVDVEPPALTGITVADTWGTTAPTNNVAISAQVVGFNAAVTVTDSNFEGDASVLLTDQLGDTCTAVVSGASATCNMTVTGTPNAFQVSYPGGTSTTTTQTMSPWGIAQSQSVTYIWNADTITVGHPSVTSQTATLLWNGGFATGHGSWSGAPLDPITISQGQEVTLYAYASGSLSTDQYPLGSVSYTVGPMTGVTMTDNQSASSSTNCSGSYNYSNQAVGGCVIVFQNAGTYTINLQYVSSDPNYASSASDALTETVIVN
jgi:hypothetical protein